MNPDSRIFDGRFGRLVLGPVAVSGLAAACPEPRIVAQFDGRELALRVGEHGLTLSRKEILLLNPGQSAAEQAGTASNARLLVFQASTEWLRERFPAMFGGSANALFRRPADAVTSRIRRLADALSIEVLNDQFLSSDRLEFMLQELMLTGVETYLAKPRTAATLWAGSRFADARIRHALSLLRAKPSKVLNMDRIASAVGLSRSRFYDLFQVCTGLAPRAYLDLLCIEAAVTRLACGESRISEVSADLGFSAQSNFTRFFLSRVGVPPSTYRRASTREEPVGQGKPPVAAARSASRGDFDNTGK